MYRMPFIHKACAGFTLVELMVTTAVLVLITTVAVPSFNSLLQGNRLTSATNQMVSAYHLARSEAIKRSQNVVLCATTDGTSCAQVSDWRHWLVIVGSDVVAQGRISTNLNITGPDGTGIVFTSAGFIRDASGAALAPGIQVCTTSTAVAKNTRTLSFAVGGGIRVAKGVTSCA